MPGTRRHIMNIEIFSDFTCPFCYIGKTKLTNAIGKVELDEEPKMIFRKYEIHPEIEGSIDIPYKQYMLEMMGGNQRKLDEFLEELTSHAEEVGLTFNFDMMIAANTADAHRLGKWVASEQKDQPYTERLMKAHFTEGKDLSNRSFLYSVVEELGLSKEKAIEVLEKNEFEYELEMDQYAAQQIGVESAPFFVFDNRFGIIGVEPEEVFTRTLKQVIGD